MLCTICGLVELYGKQTKYCSSICEKKGWRVANREKLLEGKRRYRANNKESIRAYDKMYKSVVKAADELVTRKLRRTYNCLRCNSPEHLQVHHIKHQLLGGGPNDLNNLVVLCRNCHALWHKFFNIDYFKNIPAPNNTIKRTYTKPQSADRYKLPAGVESIIPHF